MHVGVLSFAVTHSMSAASKRVDWIGIAIGRKEVTSSNLASVGYDARAKVLEVEFRSGAIYRYRDVPAEIHAELMSAESKGQYFVRRIRGRFEFRRVNETQQ
jgi:hypothetical protein